MPQRPAFAIAALSVELTAGGKTPPADFRLLPYGRFKAADGSGRPVEVPAGWLLDKASALGVAAAFNARADARVIDYEHQTLHAERNGQPAPAAAWMGRLEARDDGLYAAATEWTESAAAMIAARQYRYISPVFSYDKRTGQVLAVMHAALTNYAGLDGLTDLAALAAKYFTPFSTPEEETPMKELLKALGLAESATEAEAIAALNALRASHTAALTATGQAVPDPAKYVGVATLSAVQGELSAARTELAVLKAEKHAVSVDQVVAEAQAAGKLTPAMVGWAKDLGAKDLAALTAYCDAAPVVTKPGETQTGGAAPAGAGKPQSSDVDRAVMKALGLTPEQFAAGKPQEA
jgi:phage I-like protein